MPAELEVCSLRSGLLGIFLRLEFPDHKIVVEGKKRSEPQRVCEQTVKMPILSECIVGRTLVLGSKLNYLWAFPISSLDSVNTANPVWSTSFLSCLLGILNPDIIYILLLLLFRLGV